MDNDNHKEFARVMLLAIEQFDKHDMKASKKLIEEADSRIQGHPVSNALLHVIFDIDMTLFDTVVMTWPLNCPVKSYSPHPMFFRWIQDAYSGYWNKFKMANVFREDVEEQDPHNYTALALYAEACTWVDTDQQRDVRGIYERCIREGDNPLAKYFLAQKMNEIDRFRYMLEAAESGLEIAAIELGNYCLSFNLREDSLTKRLLKVLQSDSRNSNYVYIIGRAYGHKNNPFGLKKDLVESARLLHMAASMGNIHACYYFGKACIEGKGVPMDVRIGSMYMKYTKDHGGFQYETNKFRTRKQI